jgi:cysteine-rich repeat protein
MAQCTAAIFYVSASAMAIASPLGCHAVAGVDDFAVSDTPPTVVSSAASSGSAGAGGGDPGVCGDGRLDAGEECDDENLVDGDGCDADCRIECSADPSMHQDPETRRCYYVSSGVVAQPWEAAGTMCTALGPGWDLAAASSRDERDYVLSLVPVQTILWTGGNDLVNEGSYEWRNEEPWTNPPWDQKEPDNLGEQDCISVRADIELRFQTRNCAEPVLFVCEMTPAGSE